MARREDAPARHVIAIGSGKGGVGKSTVALNLAIAARELGQRVGLLDADLHGPNIPAMVGLRRREWTEEWTLARAGEDVRHRRYAPVERYGIAIVSAGFILGEDQAFGIGAASAALFLRQLIQHIDWGDRDLLVVDLPPGTADVQHALLRELRLDGAVLVVTPEEVAHLDARKAASMLRHARVPLIGAVENMSGFRCPHCGQVSSPFAPVPNERSLWAEGVRRLGAIAFDPAVSRAARDGRPLVLAAPESAAAAAFREIAAEVLARLG